jgi:hypothetical protein
MTEEYFIEDTQPETNGSFGGEPPGSTFGGDPVSDLRTLKRGRGGPHVRCVQGRLSLLLGDDEAAGSHESAPATVSALETSRSAGVVQQHLPASTAHAPPVFHPLAYRGIVGGWPVHWREQWGRRANDLEETGLSWRDAEAQAFVEVWNTVRHMIE